MERGSLDDLVKSWGEAREAMTVAFHSMREVLRSLSAELEEMQDRLRPALESVDGTLERLGMTQKNRHQSSELDSSQPQA